MAKVEIGKSRKWYENFCGICKKKFNLTEDRYKGHAIFKNDEELYFLACEKCAKESQFQEALKQTKEMGKLNDTHTTDIQPESKEVPSDRSPEVIPVLKGHGRKRENKRSAEKRSS